MIKELSRKLQELLNEDLEKISKETEFVKRKSKLIGEKFAKGLIFGWQRNPESSLKQLVKSVGDINI